VVAFYINCSIIQKADMKFETLLQQIENNFKNLTTADLLLVSTITRQTAERRYKGNDLAKVLVETTHKGAPQRIVPIGDLHIAGMATDHKAIIEVVKSIKDGENTFAIGTGDVLEGFNSKHLGTIVANALPYHDQLILWRQLVLDQIADKIKVAVVEHKGHEGSEYVDGGRYPWEEIWGNSGVEKQINGGTTIWKSNGGQKDKFVIYHNTSGGSEKNPVRGLWQVTTKFSNKNLPTAVFGAHIHQAAVATVNRPGMDKRDRTSVALVQNGTAKGVKDGFADPFGAGLGLGKAAPLGQNLEIYHRRGNRPNFVYPTASLEAGETVHKAMRAFDMVVKKGVLTEVLEEVRDKAGKPNVKFNKNDSHLTIDPHNEEIEDDEKKSYAPQYTKVSIDINTGMPAGWMFVGNLRRGSMSADLGAQRELVQKVKNDPNLRMFGFRQWVDESVPGSSTRRHVLSKLLNLFNPIKEKIDVLLLDAILRSSAWKNEVDSSWPIAAATKLSEGLDVPLLDNMGIVKLAVGRGKDRPVYTVQMVDGLGNRGSFANPIHGILAVYRDLSIEKAGMTAGGHMPGSGAAITIDVENQETHEPGVAATGWWARRANPSSKRNNFPAAEGWTGMVAMPGTRKEAYRLFPIANKAQWDLLDALVILTGMEKGLIDEKKFERKRR
jgi:hypothetical protein